ncbi:Regulator of nonsense transcripts 3A [Fukomys damarensis]|uniref:Regulator of nonsense transcripts 3A n=1 Tax=Fukomys damarensis TaxID=885580 RepID=A0A091EHR3_FUKDA|nr:Regulator of nonsense transcripts 3A [Fukomys damarensis]
MRSEEKCGVLDSAVTAQSPGGREKLLAAEAQLHPKSPRREPQTPPASSSGSVGGVVRPREERTAPSKVGRAFTVVAPPGASKRVLQFSTFFIVILYFSLYPHLYSRAYINFRNPDDILLFRDRFDGYVFMSSKGLEYPAVVEFAPFQKIVKRKLKKRDTKTGSIEDDPEYKQFLEAYSMEEERTNASPETLLGEIEAKTREIVARRTTPLLDYIKNRKLEKQRIREEKRARRKRELEKKRLQEEEKRKRREEERCRRKETDKLKTAVETEMRIKLLKKTEKEEEPDTEKQKERGEEVSTGDGKQESCAPCTFVSTRPSESPIGVHRKKSQDYSDKEQGDMERRIQGSETPECPSDEVRKRGGNSEFDRFPRRNEDELRWGRGFPQDRGKESQDSSVPVGTAESPSREQEGAHSLAPGRDCPGNRAL